MTGDAAEWMAVAPKEMRKGLKDVLNEMAKETKKEIYKGQKSEYALKAGRFKERDIVIKRATVSRTEAELSIKGNPISLYSGYKTRKNGIRVGGKAQVKKAGGLKELKTGSGLKAFLTTVVTKDEEGNKREYTNFFQRKGKSRFPLKSFHGPGTSKISEMLFREMKEDKEQELSRRIRMMAERILP